MLAVKGFQLMLGLCALSLIYFAAAPGVELLTLAKMVAGSFGVTILFVLLYPQLRGVRKGDKVQVTGFAGQMENPIMNLFGAIGISLVDCKMGDDIKVKIAGGRQAIGVLESYEGLFSPARVKLMYEDNKGARENAEVLK